MDRHLNLFYSYNGDNELIENNLTRAFIVTLRTVGPGARDAILHALLAEQLDALGMPCPSFGDAEFALQANLKREHARDSSRKILLTIATDLMETIGDDDTPQRQTSSIPDAWILADDHCFLIEAKVGANPLNEIQVLAHALGWLGLKRDELDRHHIGLTWYAVHSALEQCLHAPGEVLALNDQERGLLDSLAEYLRYFGYRHFDGLRFETLAPPPAVSLHPQGDTAGLAFTELLKPPSFLLARSDQGGRDR